MPLVRVRSFLLAATLAVVSVLDAASAQAATWQAPLLQEHPLAGAIVDTASGATISEADLSARLVRARFVLVGEKHDNPDHHALEQRLLTLLVRPQPSTAVVFEMLDDGQQAGIERLVAADTLAQMKETLAWPAQGWRWEDYGPLIQHTLTLGGKVLAGNVSIDLLKRVFREGEAALKAERFRSLRVLSAQEQARVQQQIYESHCEMMPPTSLGPMVTAQLAKDASMAHAMVGADAARTILIAGGFHAGKDLGVPRHLAQLASGAKTEVVLLYEVEEGLHRVEDYLEELRGLADVVWFTPRAAEVDHCESLRKHAAPSGK